MLLSKAYDIIQNKICPDKYSDRILQWKRERQFFETKAAL